MGKKILALSILFIAMISIVMAQNISQIRTGTDWQVRVELKNGSTVRGAIIGNRFIEKESYGRYYEIENYRRPGAGIRVWYVRESSGFIFLEYSKVLRVVKVRKLSRRERDKIESQLRKQFADDQKRMTAAKAAKLKKAGIALSLVEEQEALNKLEKDAKSKVKDSEIFKKIPPDMRSLLQRYPEKDGWGYDRYEKYKKRLNAARTRTLFRIITDKNGNKKKVRLRRGGAYGGLTADQRYFIEIYDRWETARRLYNYQKKQLLSKFKTEAIEKYREKKKKELAEKKGKKKTGKLLKKAKGKDVVETPKAKVPTHIQLKQVIRNILYAKSQKVRIESIQSLKEIQTENDREKFKIARILRSALRDSSKEVRLAAVNALGEIKEPKKYIAEILGNTLELGDKDMRIEAAKVLLKSSKDIILKAQESLIIALVDEDEKVRYFVVRAIDKLENKRFINHIRKKLWDSSDEVRSAAAVCMVKFQPSSTWAIRILIKSLTHKEEEIKVLAAKALKSLKSQRVKARVQKILPNLDTKVQEILRD